MVGLIEIGLGLGKLGFVAILYGTTVGMSPLAALLASRLRK